MTTTTTTRDPRTPLKKDEALEVARTELADGSDGWKASSVRDQAGQPFRVKEIGHDFTGARYHVWSDGDVSLGARTIGNVAA